MATQNRMFSPQDAANLLDEQLAANATRRDPLPAGEVLAQIMEIKINSGMSKPKEGRESAPWSRLDVKLEITDPSYLANYAGGTSPKAITTLGIMLDMQDGRIASGPNKNLRLGRLREAAGVNGKPLNDLFGQMLRIMVSHKPHPEDSSIVLDEITGYAQP